MAFDELNHSLRSDFTVPGLTPGDMRRLFDAIDADGSGEVSCDEFIDAIESVSCKKRGLFALKPAWVCVYGDLGAVKRCGLKEMASAEAGLFLL